MGDRIIVTDDEPKPKPQVVVVKEQPKVDVEKVAEKTIIIDRRDK